MLSRRELLNRGLIGAAGFLIGAPGLRQALGMGQSSLFRPAVLRYAGNWNGRPTALRTVLEQVDIRTSIPVGPDAVTVTGQEQTMFRYPLLWMTGDRQFGPLPQKAVENLRRHLSFGGTLFVDDTSGKADSPFARRLTEELQRILPGRKLEKLPAEHALYRSYYFLTRVAGRKVTGAQLQAITIDDRAAVIFSPNDLSGALERNAAGGWRFRVEPPEQENRTLALRLAVNLVVYSMTVNYKLDQVHISYRLRHPGRYPRAVLPPPEEAGAR